MSAALDQLDRYRFDSFLSDVTGADTDELYRIFKNPEAVVEYLREFQLDVAYEPNRQLPNTLFTQEGQQFWTILVLTLAPYTEAYSAADMYEWSKVAAINKPALPSLTAFRRFKQAAVPGKYAGALWVRGVPAKDIVALWRSGISLEYATATHN